MKRTVLCRKEGNWSKQESNQLVAELGTMVFRPESMPLYVAILGEYEEAAIRKALCRMTIVPFTVTYYEETDHDYPLRDV